MRENIIEKSLVKTIKNKGGICIKFVSPSMDGIPDRLVLMPKGKLAFVEVKAPSKKPRPLQLKRIRQLKELGFKVYVLDDLKDIEEIADEVQSL